MLTKTQIKIMEVFVSKINERFSINEIADKLNKPYPLIHRSIKLLLGDKFLIKDTKGFLSLNIYENHPELAFIESVRKNEFLMKNKILYLFFNDVLKNLKKDFFILLVFGSSVENKSPRDMDILLIIEDKKDTDNIEKHIRNISSNFAVKFDINVIAIESVYEMLSKRESPNVMNESLNKHIILFGGENFYKILKNAR